MSSSVELMYLLLVLYSLGQSALGGCAGKCCRGRDMNCQTTAWRMDRVYGTCYCDEGCGQTRDCCFDYFTECPAQDCVVSEWSFWSGCAKRCQPSMRVRVRRTESQPSNNGEPCPALEQRAGCKHYRDNKGKPCAAHSGPAFITSMEFAKGRPKHDSYGNPLHPGETVLHWQALGSPQCSGTWKKVQKSKHCNCPPQHSFVFI